MRHLRDEDGYLTVTAVLLLVVALAIGGVAAAAGVNGKQGQQRDARVKRALQAADAGIQSMLQRVNRLNLSNVSFNGGLNGPGNQLICPTIGLDASGAMTGAVVNVAYDAGAGMCPVPDDDGDGLPGRHEELGNGASVDTIWVTQPAVATTGVRFGGYIMATGTADGVRRRVRAQLTDLEPLRTVDALGGVRLRSPGTATNLLVSVAGDIRSNARVRFQGPGLKTVVAPLGLTTGTVAYGDRITYEDGADTINSAGVFEPIELDDPFSRNGIDLPADKPDCPSTGCPLGYEPSSRSFKRSVSGRVEFPAGDYVFCSFSLKGSGEISIPLLADGAVRIFVDPSRCPSGDYLGAGSFVVETGTSGVLGLAADPNVDPILNPNSGSSSTLQVYLVGSENRNATTLTYRPGHTYGGLLSTVLGLVTSAATPPLPAVFYAPRSKVHVQNVKIIGSITGHDVLLDATTILAFDVNLLSLPFTNSLGTFNVNRYVECSSELPDPLAGEPPDAHC